MVDFFAVLGIARQPSVDLETLKGAFLELSSRLHPDKQASASSAEANLQFSRLNEAYNTLRNSKARIMHLLELEGFQAKERFQSISTDIANLFSEVGKVVHDADELAKERNRTTSPMLKAALFARGVELTDGLQSWQQTLQLQRAKIEGQLMDFNSLFANRSADGNPSDDPAFQRLYSIAVELGFIQRLQQQVDEKLSVLAF